MNKLAAVALAGILTCTALTACTPAKTGHTSESAKPLKVGMELAYPPFEGKDAAGKAQGISPDLAQDFGTAIGRPVEIENIAWDGLIPSLQSGRVDMVISSMTITDERAKAVTFTDPYAKAYLAFLVAEGSPAKEWKELDDPGRTIAVKKGTTGETFVRAQLPKANVTALSSENACVTEVAQKKADAFIYDQLTIYRQHEANAATTRMVAIKDQEPQRWGAAVKKGNEALAKQFNEFLGQHKADESKKLTEKYLKKEKATFDRLGFTWFFD